MSDKKNAYKQLLSKGYTHQYIHRAFKTYEVKYGTLNYNIQALQKLILTLQNTEIQNQFLTTSYLTLQEAADLKPHDEIDHQDHVGRWVTAQVTDKIGTDLKIHYIGWLASSWDIWCDYTKELHRFAKIGSWSKRKSYRFGGDWKDQFPLNSY
eukprot:104974_1